MENIKLSINEGIALITLSRPKALNALNKFLLEDLHQVLKDLESQENVRVLILTGEGEKAFVAGADIKEFPSLSKEDATEMAAVGQERVFDKIHHYPKPIIAAVNGYALGGGLELALACHIRVGSQNAVLGLPEVTLGLLPGYGGTQRLPMLIGRGRALEMILTGDPIDAEKAEHWGILNSVGDNAIEEAEKIAKRLIKRYPSAQKAALQSVHSYYNEQGLKEEIKRFGQQFQTPDFNHGVDAFLNKRK